MCIQNGKQQSTELQLKAEADLAIGFANSDNIDPAALSEVLAPSSRCQGDRVLRLLLRENKVRGQKTDEVFSRYKGQC